MKREAIIESALDAILLREGRFVNHPADRGGPTKYGITQETLSQWRQTPVTAADVEALEELEAREILRNLYVKPFLGIHHDALFELAVDMAVNHGVSRSVRYLQRAVGVREDGILGPATRAALDISDGWTIFSRALASRARLYGKIITRDPSQAVFAAGWMDRLASFVERST